MSVQAEPRERVLEATYSCVARFGMGKTTVEDVVKESGVSRASIYRLFPGGKDQLLRETVGWEMNRFFARLAEAVYDAPDFASLLEEGLVFAHRAIQEHQVLRKVLESRRNDPAGNLLPGDAYVFGDEIGRRVHKVRRAWQTAVLRAHRHRPVWIWKKKSGRTLSGRIYNEMPKPRRSSSTLCRAA